MAVGVCDCGTDPAPTDGIGEMVHATPNHGHLMRRRHGGRRARVRGTPKVDADFNLLAAAANVARLAVLGLQSPPAVWAVTA